MKLKLSTQYSQRDAAWASKILGFNPPNSKYNIGGYGCLITSITNYANAVGYEDTPDELNDKLKAVKGFVPLTGYLIWNKVFEIYDFSYHYTSRWFGNPLSDADLQKLADFIEDGYAPIIEIDFDPSTGGEQQHFVLGVGLTDDGEILIHDPWTGNVVPVSVYGDPKKSIYHYKVYDRKLQTTDSLLKDIPIDWDDYEGHRHTVGWYVYEWENEKGKNEELIDEIQTKDKDIEGLSLTLAKKELVIQELIDKNSGLTADYNRVVNDNKRLEGDIQALKKEKNALEANLGACEDNLEACLDGKGLCTYSKMERFKSLFFC